MGQSINDIRHMRDLAQALREDAGKTEQSDYSQKLLKAAADLDARAKHLSQQNGIFPS